MFYKIRNILCLTVLALLLVQTNITKLYAQGVVTLADNAENEDPALNQDIPDEIALFDDSIESEVPSEVPAEAGNAAPSTPDSVKAPEEKQTPAETVVEEDISVEDIIAAAPAEQTSTPLVSADVLNQPGSLGILGQRSSAPKNITEIDDRVFSQMSELEKMIRDNIRMDVENLTCTGGRRLAVIREELEKMEDDAMFLAYADALLSQMPCFRMNNSTRRNRLYLDPNLKGIIYHTIKFCDYYGFEYASIKRDIKVPLLKIETDFTSQSAGQLLTRVQAFAETLEGSEDMDPSKGISEEIRKKMESGVYYVAGIDSGSTSTDVVILDKDGKIKSTMIIPTGGGAMMSAEKSLEMAVEKAGIRKEDIVRIVTTGYGRAYIDSGDDSITEITCHAKGAHYLNPNVRTVIDIGGQDIKAISIDENGAVKNFLMNDKCAAGTGRFLEMMARTLGLSLEEMSTRGLEWKENVVISSMCTVFAESEVVSLVAQNKDVADIIHGLNVSVASKVGALAARLGKKNPGEYMMTGGVARNKGIIQALEEKLGAKLYICDEAQLCGALGAAIFAYEKCKDINVQKI